MAQQYSDANLTIIYSSCAHQQDISISFCLNLTDLSLAEHWTSKQAISIEKRKYAEFIYANSSKILDQTLISNYDPHLINIIWSEVDPCFLSKTQISSSPSFARMAFRLDQFSHIMINVLIDLNQQFFKQHISKLVLSLALHSPSLFLFLFLSAIFTNLENKISD